MVKYFLYSDEQIKEKNSILARTGKMFEPGTIVVSGKKVKFSQITNDISTMSRFPDAKLIASGEESTFTYVMPKTSPKKGR